MLIKLLGILLKVLLHLNLITIITILTAISQVDKLLMKPLLKMDTNYPIVLELIIMKELMAISITIAQEAMAMRESPVHIIL